MAYNKKALAIIKNEMNTQIDQETTNQVDPAAFISLAQAAKISGYHQDYLGQLARAGKLDAQKIGRNWVTTLNSVNKLKGLEQAAAGEMLTPQPQTQSPEPVLAPAVSVEEYEAMKQELSQLRQKVVEQETNKSHDAIYSRQSSFQDNARQELLPTAPLNLAPAATPELLPELTPSKILFPRIATALAFLIISWAVTAAIVYFAYNGSLPKLASNIFHLGQEPGTISGADYQ